MPNETRICPSCAETIEAAAIVCRFCSREVGSHPGTDGPHRLRMLPGPVTETTLLELPKVLITSARVVISDRTYATASITSVTVAAEPYSGSSAGILLIGGIGGLLVWTGYYLELLLPSLAGGILYF
jgi:hypothetical protein